MNTKNKKILYALPFSVIFVLGALSLLKLFYTDQQGVAVIEEESGLSENETYSTKEIYCANNQSMEEGKEQMFVGCNGFF